jgi:predicted N-acetyltransferase YhbS
MAEGFVGGLRVCAPEPTLHLSALARLISETFWGGTEESTLATVGDALRPGGSYNWQGSRIGCMDDGAIATHAGLIDFRLRVGSQAQLHAAGLCAIFTVEAYRRRGWMRRTMNDLLTCLSPAGYDISLLYGIDDFYHHFDYRRAWPEHRFEVAIADLPAVRSVSLEGFEEQYPEAVVELSNRHQHARTGTVVREGGWFTKLVEDRGYLWRNAVGDVIGYVLTRLNDEQLLVTDHAGNADEVLGVIRQLMDSTDRQKVRLPSISPRCELAQRLRRMNSREIVQHQHNGGALVRLVNLHTTMQKLIPDLEVRLRESAWSDWNGHLRLDNDEQAVDLQIAAGRVEVAASTDSTAHEVNGPGLAQLVIGTDAVGSLVEEGGLAVRGDGGTLAEVMFPVLHPSMPEPDHF